jgi:nucleoside-diphosphate-sugar epimerase
MPTPTTWHPDPKSPYALQKWIIEQYLQLFYNLYGLKSVALRYFNVFGPGQYGDSPYSTAVAAWCHAVKNGQACRLDGDGQQTRDMTYVDNVVEANVRAAETMLCSTGDKYSWDGRPYNVGCGDRISNNDILKLFKARLPNLQVKGAPARVGDVKHTQADISRACDELGYNVQVRFNEGLERTWKWWGL